MWNSFFHRFFLKERKAAQPLRTSVPLFTAEQQILQQAGFTREQIIRLTTFRDSYLPSSANLSDEEYHRFVFARWLVFQGKISEQLKER